MQAYGKFTGGELPFYLGDDGKVKPISCDWLGRPGAVKIDSDAADGTKLPHH